MDQGPLLDRRAGKHTRQCGINAEKKDTHTLSEVRKQVQVRVDGHEAKQAGRQGAADGQHTQNTNYT